MKEKSRKRCSDCRKYKSINRFSNDKNRADGKSYTCKQCNSERACKWSKKNRERVQANQLAWRTKNRKKVNAQSKARRDANIQYYRAQEKRRRQTPEGKASTRWNWIKRKYGLDKEQWHTLFNTQDKRCGCCGSKKPGSKNGWHTEHDHKTGKVRGITCVHCNLMISGARDSIDKLRAGIKYMEKNAH